MICSGFFLIFTSGFKVIGLLTSPCHFDVDFFVSLNMEPGVMLMIFFVLFLALLLYIWYRISKP